VASGDAVRAFFAIELGEPARRAAAEVARRLREAPGGDGVRWVRPEALHVTLRFLGDIAPAQVAPLARRAAGELAALAPFALRLGPAALFPTPRRPRVVALDLAPEAPLTALAAALERAVVAEGFAPEPRAFRAHLTLGRVPLRGVSRRDRPCHGARLHSRRWRPWFPQRSRADRAHTARAPAAGHLTRVDHPIRKKHPREARRT
jgi:2'-5' RNA ligase